MQYQKNKVDFFPIVKAVLLALGVSLLLAVTFAVVLRATSWGENIVAARGNRRAPVHRAFLPCVLVDRGRLFSVVADFTGAGRCLFGRLVERDSRRQSQKVKGKGLCVLAVCVK